MSNILENFKYFEPIWEKNAFKMQIVIKNLIILIVTFSFLSFPTIASRDKIYLKETFWIEFKKKKQ